MTEIRTNTLIGLLSDRVNEINNPRCELILEHLQELEAAIDKSEADTKRLDWIDEKIDNLDICGEGDFYIMINEDLDYENIIRADNIRDLIDKCK